MNNIALIVASPYISGAEYVASDIFKVLKKDFPNTHIIGRDNFLKISEINTIDKSICVDNLPSFKISQKPISLIKYFITGLQMINILQTFDLFYCNDIESCFMIMPIAIILNKKVIFHIHDIYKNNNRVKILFLILNLFVDNFVSLTEKNKERLRKMTVKKITVIHNAISPLFEINSKNENIGNKVRDKNNILTIGFVGQIVQWKRPCKVLDFLLYLRDKGLNVKLKIAGSYDIDHDKNYVDNLFERINDCGNYVEYVGFVERNNLTSFYQSLDFFVSFSENEPFGLVMIEALYHGLPVITSEGDGPREIIKNSSQGIVISSFEDGYEYIMESIKENSCSSSKLRTIYASSNFSQDIFSNKIIAMIKDTF
jgi:glycosyltransferase involved in cell wall biosynthesis